MGDRYGAQALWVVAIIIEKYKFDENSTSQSAAENANICRKCARLTQTSTANKKILIRGGISQLAAAI